MCADPHSERRTTFTECCCLHGVAWSGQCAFCPSKDSGEWKHVQIDRQSETPGICSNVINFYTDLFFDGNPDPSAVTQLTMQQCATCPGKEAQIVFVIK